jgi:hypothetical protein
MGHFGAYQPIYKLKASIDARMPFSITAMLPLHSSATCFHHQRCSSISAISAVHGMKRNTIQLYSSITQPLQISTDSCALRLSSIVNCITITSHWQTKLKPCHSASCRCTRHDVVTAPR